MKELIHKIYNSLKQLSFKEVIIIFTFIIALFTIFVNLHDSNARIRPFVGVDAFAFAPDLKNASSTINFGFFFHNVGSIPANNAVASIKILRNNEIISSNIETEKKVILPNGKLLKGSSFSGRIDEFWNLEDRIEIVILIEYSGSNFQIFKPFYWIRKKIRGFNTSNAYFYKCEYVLEPELINYLIAPIPMNCFAN